MTKDLLLDQDHQRFLNNDSFLNQADIENNNQNGSLYDSAQKK